MTSLQDFNAEELSWKLFELTGELRYYLFYKSLEATPEPNQRYDDELSR